jgi:hypothetical protein
MIAKVIFKTKILRGMFFEKKSNKILKNLELKTQDL